MTPVLVRDINGKDEFDEEEKINKITNLGWELVAVIPLNLCRRCYFRKVEPLEPPEVTARKQAALKVLHDETLESGERLNLAFKVALGQIDPLTLNDTVEHTTGFREQNPPAEPPTCKECNSRLHRVKTNLYICTTCALPR